MLEKILWIKNVLSLPKAASLICQQVHYVNNTNSYVDDDSEDQDWHTSLERYTPSE